MAQTIPTTLAVENRRCGERKKPTHGGDEFFLLMDGYLLALD